MPNLLHKKATFIVDKIQSYILNKHTGYGTDSPTLEWDVWLENELYPPTLTKHKQNGTVVPQIFLLPFQNEELGGTSIIFSTLIPNLQSHLVSLANLFYL
jgi:hypothetical protein